MKLDKSSFKSFCWKLETEYTMQQPLLKKTSTFEFSVFNQIDAFLHSQFWHAAEKNFDYSGTKSILKVESNLLNTGIKESQSGVRFT